MLLLIQEIMIKNLPEFKALIIRYETITIEEIEQHDMQIQKLTGFGSPFSCTLCVAVDKLFGNNNCKYCVYYASTKRQMSCFKGINRKTYDGIDNHEENDYKANELLTAYRNRAKHMRSILKKLNIEMP